MPRPAYFHSTDPSRTQAVQVMQCEPSTKENRTTGGALAVVIMQAAMRQLNSISDPPSTVWLRPDELLQPS